MSPLSSQEDLHRFSQAEHSSIKSTVNWTLKDFWINFLTQNWMILTLNRFIARVYEKKIIKRDSWKTTFIFWLTWTLRETVDNFIWRTISWNALFSLLAVSVTPTEPQSTSQWETAMGTVTHTGTHGQCHQHCYYAILHCFDDLLHC